MEHVLHITLPLNCTSHHAVVAATGFLQVMLIV